MSDADDGPPDKLTLIHAIMKLLDKLDAERAQTRDCRWSSEGLSVDYSVSVAGFDQAPGGLNSGGMAPPAITTRCDDDELLIAADLPNVQTEDVEANLNSEDRTVSILLAREEIWSVPLADFDGWSITDFSVTNDILEVRLTHE